MKDIRRPERLSELATGTTKPRRRLRVEVEHEQAWPPAWMTSRNLVIAAVAVGGLVAVLVWLL